VVMSASNTASADLDACDVETGVRQGVRSRFRTRSRPPPTPAQGAGMGRVEGLFEASGRVSEAMHAVPCGRSTMLQETTEARRGRWLPGGVNSVG